MMGHNICFYEEIWILIPKLSLQLLLIWSTELSANELYAENAVNLISKHEMGTFNLMQSSLLICTNWPISTFHFLKSLGFINGMYRKNSKNWDTLNYYRDCPTNGIVGFYSAILRSKDADRITNRVDTDQTAP